MYKRQDNDGDGEVGLGGVTVNLVDDGGNVVATTTTADGTGPEALGSYLFEDVVPGDYTVVEVQPTTHLTVTDGDSTDPSDDANNASTTDNLIPVSVVSGEADTGNDFVEEEPASISGTVTVDTDNDGDGEVGLGGVIVNLVDDGGNVVATTTTADGTGPEALGSYLFEDVVPGDYTVVEVQPTTHLTVTDVDSTDPSDDASNASTTDNQIPVSVVSGEADTGNDFVEEVQASISGTVTIDTNNDDLGDCLLYTSPSPRD